MLHRVLPADPTLADRVGHFVYGLFFGMESDWYRRGLRHVHKDAINARILGLWKRLRSVLERYQAGTLRAGRTVTRHDTSPRPSPQSGEGVVAQGEGDS